MLTLESNHLAQQFSTIQKQALRQKQKNMELRFKSEHQRLPFGFLELPYQKNLAPYARLASPIQKKMNTLLTLGIGGSSLGTKAALEALNLNPKTNFLFLESPHPSEIERTFRKIDFQKTTVNVVSKSGNTLETIALFFLVLEELQKKVPASRIQEHIIITTEKNENFLYTLAKQKKWRVLEIPKNVPGRYSVLSAVGLFALCVAGANIKSILAGAREMWEHPQAAFDFATWAYGAHRLLHRPIHVFFPYDPRLSFFADWFLQLWAESLGKSETSGPTPLKALGPQDQHSLCQLFLAGPRDKWFTLLSVRSHKPTFKISGSLGSFSYLKNKDTQTILQAELEATQTALQAFQNPTLHLSIHHLDEKSLGALFMFFELATVACGYFYDINPFDQPAVEHIKRHSRSLLTTAPIKSVKPHLDSSDTKPV